MAISSAVGDHSDAAAFHIVGENAPTSNFDSADCIDTATSSHLPAEYTNIHANRYVFDASGQSLRDVLGALETQNSERIVDSMVQDEWALLNKTESIVFARLVTSIGMNCVESTFISLRSALELEKERVQDYQRKRLEQIQHDRTQMTLLFAARSKQEEKYREEEERLLEQTEKAVIVIVHRDGGAKQKTIMFGPDTSFAIYCTVTAYICEAVRLVHDAKVNGKTLPDLNDRIAAKSEGEASSPLCVEFKHLRRSGRLPAKKRNYTNMQGIGRLAKRPRLPDNKCLTDPLPDTSTSDSLTEPHDEGPSEHLSKPQTNVSASNNPATSESTIDKSSVGGPDSAEGLGLDSPGTDDLPISAICVHEGDQAVDNISPITHDAGYGILDTFFDQSVISSGVSRPVSNGEPDEGPAIEFESMHREEALDPTIQFNTPEALDAVSSKAFELFDPDLFTASAAVSESGSNRSSEPESLSTDPTRYTPSETHLRSDVPREVQHTAYVKRPILDDPAPWLEHVLTAIETDDTSHQPNQVPGVLDDISKKGDFTVYTKIMTSITENWVRYYRSIARPTFDAAQEKSREVERDKIRLYARRLTSATVSRRQNQKTCPKEIAHLDIRGLAEMEMQKLLSEPEELTGEFREESDYEAAIRYIEKGNADDERIRLRRLWKETYLWPMIQQGAKMVGPLPKPPGPKSEITPEERSAAKKLIIAMGYGKSRDNIYKWTAYWKLLSELRDKGVTALLLHRTSEFKSYFFQHPKELDKLLSWIKVYDFPLRQLGARTLAQEGNDFSGKSDIEEKWIFDRFHAPQTLCWGDHLSMWDPDSTEHENFLANCNIKPTSRKSNIYVLRYGLKGQHERNRSNFVSLVPYKGESGKKTLGSRASSTDLITIAPLVPILPGDFLGIFSGRLRYTDQKPPRSIPGPVPNLWLDYSEVRGKLGRIGVAKANEMANVCLAWEGVNEVKGEPLCQYLRVLVIATRHIMPFDQLVRPPVV